MKPEKNKKVATTGFYSSNAWSIFVVILVIALVALVFLLTSVDV